jgi:Caspase domain
MKTQWIKTAWAALGSLALLLLSLDASLAADCASSPAPQISVQAPDQAAIRAGEPFEIRWKSAGSGSANCRVPLYLVFATSARVRFEGDGFLAMPPVGKGPYDIADKLDQTRVFIPLHALPDTASGAFKIKFYGAGESAVDWFVTRVTGDFRDAKKRASAVVAAAKQPLKVTVASGKPAIVVRDAFMPDIAAGGEGLQRPKRTVVSNSNEFELQVFEKFYRVYDIKTGELVIERAGINPNFSPSSRFLGSYGAGPGFEIVDLYADTVIATTDELNRNGAYEGMPLHAAWSRNDAVVALGLQGWGGFYIQQPLIDGPGMGEGRLGSHAGWGISQPILVDFDTGIVTWGGWASLFERMPGSRMAEVRAKKEIPVPDGDNDAEQRRTALEEKLEQQYLTNFEGRYLFDAKVLFGRLPKREPGASVYDGSVWYLGGEVRFSHVCIASNEADNCESEDAFKDAKGKAELNELVKKRVQHRIVKNDEVPGVHARLAAARAAIPLVTRTLSSRPDIWLRMAQLGVPLSSTSRAELPVQSFDSEALFDNPTPVVSKLEEKIPSIGKILVPEAAGEALDIPDYKDEQHEIKLIIPRKIRDIANWTLNGTAYWLIHENYQGNNLATPNQQYLHLVSGDTSGISRVIDLSTRLGVDGILATNVVLGQDISKEYYLSGEFYNHLWPADFDIATVVAGKYLLASGHWLRDASRWALVYDLTRDKTLLFIGTLPNGGTIKALSVTDDSRLLVVVSSSGQVYFYDTKTGKQVLSGNYVDDEMAIYDNNAYYTSTPEGSQFVFLKFPGLPGYLPFKQFAKSLSRPDVIKAVFRGTPAPGHPDLSPPPRLTLTAQAVKEAPGTFRISISVDSQRELAELRLFVDGQLWSEREVHGRELRIDEPIALPAQARWLTAVAVDAAGSESVPVAYAVPPDKRPSTRKLSVFGVGTDAYANLGQSLQLKFAVSDAKSFLSAVSAQKSGYYKSVEAKPFLNAPGLKAELPKALRAAASSAAQDDTIMLFVSGHGYRAPGGKLYLLLTDSKAGEFEETSLSWDELASAFDGTKARIIVFIDACHSGAVPDGGSNDEIADALSARQVRFTVLAAAKGRQESFEKPVLGGVFTGAIVKAISGGRAGIDTNNNGVVELSELYSKVKPQVLTEMGGQQTPWLARADMVGEVPLF